MAVTKVLLCDRVDPAGAKLFQDAGIEVVERETVSAADAGLLASVEGVVVRSASRITEETMAACPNLRVVGRAGAGVDNIDVRAATRLGIVVMNAAGGNTITTAEHTIALLMSMARMTPQANASLKEGRWERSRFLGAEVYEKTLGVIGLGKVGSAVATRALGLGMKVLGYDPYLASELASKLGVQPATLGEIFEQSDFITVHTPLTSETRHLICKQALGQTKRGVRIINCARGGLVDEEALLEALESGQVAAAALDVFSMEPPPAGHPLIRHPRVICTPHLGASTQEAQVAVSTGIARQMIDYLVHGSVHGAVNVPSVSAETLATIRPFLSLGRSIGSFAGQAFGCAFEEIFIEFSGEIAEFDVSPVTQSILVGLLSGVIERINFVNASVVAHERGIKVTEAKVRQVRDYGSLVQLRLKTPNGEKEVAGTVFDRTNPRIVSVNGFRLEAIPKGCMIFLLNRDLPGVIGRVATLLGDHGINIGRFHLGRKEIGGTALALIQVDTEPEAAQIEALGKLPGVLSARHLSLD